MSSESHHGRFAPVMWGAIGVTFLVLAMVAGLGLDARISGYAVGTLVLVCLAVCGATFWVESRSGRATARLADQFRSRSTNSSSTSAGAGMPNED